MDPKIITNIGRMVVTVTSVAGTYVVKKLAPKVGKIIKEIIKKPK